MKGHIKMELTKGKLYGNGKVIYRLISFMNNEDLIFVINCFSLKTSYIDEDSLNDFFEITEIEMQNAIGLNFPDIKSLSKQQKKMARDRYNLISSVLAYVEIADLRHERLEYISKIYGITKRRLERLLNAYLAFGNKTALIDCEKQPQYPLKPKLRELKYDGSEIPGFALLTKIELRKGFHLYLLIDSYSKYIYGFKLSNKDRDYSAIKTLVIECNSRHGFIPAIINTAFSTETWSSYYRNLQCLGIDIQFCHHRLFMFPYLFDVINEINKCILSGGDINRVCSFLKELIKKYNNKKQKHGCSPKELFLDARPIFKDSFVSESNESLLFLLNHPYKEYLK